MKRGKSKTSLKNSKNTKIVLGIFALIFISTVFAYTIINTPASGYRVIKKGGSQEINVHSITCKNVTNKNLAYDIFVPTNQSEEWSIFLSKKPNYVNVTDCGKPSCTRDCTGKICGSDGCEGTCGDCPTGKVCNNFGTACIIGTCEPDCFGASCGDDDGCGGKCDGSCPYPRVCNSATYTCYLPEGKCVTESDCEPGETCEYGTCVLLCSTYQDCPESDCEWWLNENLDLCASYCEQYWFCDTWGRCRYDLDRLFSPPICL